MSSGMDHLDGDTSQGHSRDAGVTREESGTQSVREGDVSRVVCGPVGAKLPDPLEKGLMRMAHYSHSMVAGGLLVMSRTTRFTWSTSFVIRVLIPSSTSYGSRPQSAVIASSLVTGRSPIGYPYVRPFPCTPTE